MKKFLCVILACMVIALAGCSDNANSAKETEQVTVPETTVPPTTESVPIETETEPAPYPMQLTSDSYDGPECWLLDEPSVSTVETVFDVYANIDETAGNWHDEVKSVIALVWSQYSTDESVILKIYNATDDWEKPQPTYQDIIAIWQNKPFSAFTDSVPTITWYPEGAGMNSPQESESWNP